LYGSGPERTIFMSHQNRKDHRNRKKARRRPHVSRGVESFSYVLPDGSRALYVGEVICETDPPAVREGIARRRMLAMEGRCPCGAIVPFDPRVVAPLVALNATEHAGDCPAAESNLAAALRTARRAG
jgi:hypothetical protein